MTIRCAWRFCYRGVAQGLVVVGSMLASGCALTDQLARLDHHHEHLTRQLASRHQDFALQITDKDLRRQAQSVAQPWIVGKAQPLARDVRLPYALQKNVLTTMLFDQGPLTLPEIAQRITFVTNIPVQVQPEALLDRSHFMSRLSDITTNTTGLVDGERFELFGESEPLADILDRVAAAFSIQWQYRQDKLIFYRTETRVFNVQALTLEAKAQASLGQGIDTTTEAGFSSRSQTLLTTPDSDVFAAINARLEPFLSRAGVIVAQPGASSTIVVTDTPAVLDQIGAYLERENRVLTRRIRLVFEEITLVSEDQDDITLDWDLLYTSAKLAARASSGANRVVAASVATAELAQGPWRGSDALVAALAKSGKIIRHSSVPVLTLNRRPVTHAVRSTFSYIDRVDTTAYSDGLNMGLPSVSVSQKEETVGSLLTLVPDAQEDGRILLSVSYDNTVAQPLKTVLLGDKSHPLQLQQITIDGNGTVQQMLIEPGEPVLISGFDRGSKEADSQRTSRRLPLLFGGQDHVTHAHTMTVLIITAQVEEGV